MCYGTGIVRLQNEMFRFMWRSCHTHGVLSQQVLFGVGFAAVDGPQSAEQRSPAREDLRRTHLHQLPDRRYHLQV